mgnify:CR=1 FL=1
MNGIPIIFPLNSMTEVNKKVRFCLVSLQPPWEGHGKKYRLETNHIEFWATVMGGTCYCGPAFDNDFYNLDYDYFNEFDIVMIALRDELIDVGLKIKKLASPKVVIFLDAEIEHFTCNMRRELQPGMIELLNVADAVAVLHDETIPLLKLLTTKPVGLVGLPFPLERVRKICPPVQKTEEIELGSIMGASWLRNRNGLVNVTALSEIGMPGTVDIWHPVEILYVESMREFVSIPPIRYRGAFGWQDYITEANKSHLGLHLDFRLTWGRFPVDCAGVRMPCVAPSTLYTQKKLFPGLCVAYYDLEHVKELVIRLVSESKFYEETVAYAESQLSFFSPQKTRERLFNLL